MYKNKRPFEIIVLGPPVSGKGTQAGLLSKTFDIPHISTGQILHAIKDEKENSLSSQVAGYMDTGGLVPDELVNKLVLERIKKDDCEFGYVLDGYPRTYEQAKVIDEGADIDFVFLIDVSDETVIERISGRRVCKSGHSWHIKYSPTEKEGVCDKCGQELFMRDDDKPEVVKNRLNKYHQNTDPIVKLFEENEKMIRIDGEQHIEQVFEEMIKYLVNYLRYKLDMGK